MKWWRLVLMIVFLQLGFTGAAKAQIAVLEIIKAGVKKVIKAIDLKIQREQNKVIWLQNAQKTLENTMSKLKLDEITDWTQKQKDLYKNYYEELANVKSIITYYQRIRDITEKQARMLGAYKQALQLFKKDQHFTSADINYMEKVYSGMLDESIKNIDQIASVIEAFTTSMTDAERLKLINAAADKIDKTYNDMHQFTQQNKMLSLQRARTEADIKVVKQLYNLN